MGLVPKKAIVDAGRHYLHKQQRSTGLPESEIIRMAVRSMGLDEVAPFNPEEKIIEYLIANKSGKKLVDLTCRGFAEETASESPAPGGGSVSAYMGALAAALGTMVANLSAHKAGWDDRWELFSDYADGGEKLLERLLHLVDEDTESFNRIMAAIQMPKGSDAEKTARARAMEEATLYATQVPLRTMEAAADCFDLCEAMVDEGNPASVSDAGVGALAARAAVLGAGMNVRINARDLKDRDAADRLVSRAAELERLANEREAQITAKVHSKI